MEPLDVRFLLTSWTISEVFLALALVSTSPSASTSTFLTISDDWFST